jgi:hypothetical protein
MNNIKKLQELAKKRKIKITYIRNGKRYYKTEKQLKISLSKPSKKTNNKKLKFGGIIPIDGTLFEKLSGEPGLINMIQREVSTYDIQVKYKNSKKYLKDLLNQFWIRYDTPNNYGNNRRIAPWLILDPREEWTSKWIQLATTILKKQDFSLGSFWFETLEYLVSELAAFNDPFNLILQRDIGIPTNSQGDIFDPRYLRDSEESVKILLEIIGIIVDFDGERQDGWIHAETALNYYEKRRTMQFGAGDIKSLQFYKNIIKIRGDIGVINDKLKDELNKRCINDLHSPRCQMIVSELLFNIFYSLIDLRHKTPKRKKIIKIVDKIWLNYVKNVNPEYEFTKFKITNSQLPNLSPLLHLFQGEYQSTLDSVSTTYLATACLAYYTRQT